ncbi:MAG: rRNA maturation RNase YbeY [Chlamydiae bacterium]|nr:rRNA maturation RNase YbeY [Chlamydiota bacterium]
MQVTVHNRQKDLPLSLTSLKKLIPVLLDTLHARTGEVVIQFVSKKKISEIHGVFFADPTPTDCMTFPLDPPIKSTDDLPVPHVLGEIIVCPWVAVDYAASNGLDPHQETLLYVIHGLLHLLGYDDQDAQSRKKMRSMEKKCLKQVHAFSLKPRTLH